jgi:hypothetical protein
VPRVICVGVVPGVLPLQAAASNGLVPGGGWWQVAARFCPALQWHVVCAVEAAKALTRLALLRQVRLLGIHFQHRAAAQTRQLHACIAGLAR